MNSLPILLVLVLFVGELHALVERKLVPSNSDSTVLAKILQSVDAANSHEHLFDVTLKLLKSLCVCMRETLREKEENILFNDGSNSLQADNHVHSRDVLGLYRRIYNNTCFSLQQELAGKLNTTRNTPLGDNNDEAFLEQTNCGKRIANEIDSAINSPKQHLKDEIESKLQHILYKTLIDTKDFHKYRITRRSLFGKAKPHVKSSLGHSVIVILTLHPKFVLNKTVPDSETIEENELNETLYTKSIVDIDIIDAKYDVLSKESEELANNDIVLDCNLQSVYTFLVECEKNNMTKVFRLLRKHETIKIYIEVTTLRNHTDYSSICCDDEKTIGPCKKNFIRRFSRSEESVEIKHFAAQPIMTKKQKEYKDTLTKVQNWVKLYEKESGLDNKTSVRLHKTQNKNSLITPTNSNKKEIVINYLDLKIVRENLPSKLNTHSVPLEQFDKTDDSLNTIFYKSAKSLTKSTLNGYLTTHPIISTLNDTNNVHQNNKLELEPLKSLFEEKAVYNANIITPSVVMTNNSEKISCQLVTETDNVNTELIKEEPLTSSVYTAFPNIHPTPVMRNVNDKTTSNNVLTRDTVPNVTTVRPGKTTYSIYNKDYSKIGNLRSEIATEASAFYKKTLFKEMAMKDFTTSDYITDLKANTHAEQTSEIVSKRTPYYSSEIEPTNIQTNNLFTLGPESNNNWLHHKTTKHKTIHKDESISRRDNLFFSFGDSSHLQPLTSTEKFEQMFDVTTIDINHFTSDGILKTNLMRQNFSMYDVVSQKNKGKFTEYISKQEPELSSDVSSTTNIDRSLTRSNTKPSKIITKVHTTTPGADGIASAIEILYTNVKTSLDKKDIRFTKKKNSKLYISTVPYKDTSETVVTDKLDRMKKIFQRTTERSIIMNSGKAKLSAGINKTETNNNPTDKYLKTTANNLRKISESEYITKGHKGYRPKKINSTALREHLPSVKYPITEETTPIQNTVSTTKIYKEYIFNSATNENSLPSTLDTVPLKDSTISYQEIISNTNPVVLPSEARSDEHDTNETKTSHVLDITPSKNILELNNQSTGTNSNSKYESVNSMRNQHQVTGQLKLLDSKQDARRESMKKNRQRQIKKKPNYNSPNIYLNDDTSTVILQSDKPSKKNNIDEPANPTVSFNSSNDYVMLPTYDARRDSTQLVLNFGRFANPVETTTPVKGSLTTTVTGASINNVSNVILAGNYNLRHQNSSPFVRYITATSTSAEVNETYLISKPQIIEGPRALSLTKKLSKSITDYKDIFVNEANSEKSKPASRRILGTKAIALMMTTENNPHSKKLTVEYNENDYNQRTETSDIKYTENNDKYDTNNNNDVATLAITHVMKPKISSTKQNTKIFQQPNSYTLPELTIKLKLKNISQTDNMFQTKAIIASNIAGFTKKVSKNDIHNKTEKSEKTEINRDVKITSKQFKIRANVNETGDIRKIFEIPVTETLMKSSLNFEKRITRQSNYSRLITDPTYSSYNPAFYFGKSSKNATTISHGPDLVTSSTYKLTAEAPKFLVLQFSTENSIKSTRKDNVTNISTAQYYDTTSQSNVATPSIVTASNQNQQKFGHKEEKNNQNYSRNSSFRGFTEGIFLRTLQTVAYSEVEQYNGQWSTTNEARSLPQSSNYSIKMTVMNDNEVMDDSKRYNQHLEKSTSERSLQRNVSETSSQRRDTNAKVTTEITNKESFAKVANSAINISRLHELTTIIKPRIALNTENSSDGQRNDYIHTTHTFTNNTKSMSSPIIQIRKQLDLDKLAPLLKITQNSNTFPTEIKKIFVNTLHHIQKSTEYPQYHQYQPPNEQDLKLDFKNMARKIGMKKNNIPNMSNILSNSTDVDKSYQILNLFENTTVKLSKKITERLKSQETSSENPAIFQAALNSGHMKKMPAVVLLDTRRIFTPSSTEEAIHTLDYDGKNYQHFNNSLSEVLAIDTTKTFKHISINTHDKTIPKTARSTGSLNVNNLRSVVTLPTRPPLEDYGTNLKSGTTLMMSDKTNHHRGMQSPILQKYATFKSDTITSYKNNSNTDNSRNSSTKAVNLFTENSQTSKKHTQQNTYNSETNKSTNETIEENIATTRNYRKNIDSNVYKPTKQDVEITYKLPTSEVIERTTKKFLTDLHDQHLESTKKYVNYHNSRKHLNLSNNQNVYSTIRPISINMDSIMKELKNTTLLKQDLVSNNTIKSTEENIRLDKEYIREFSYDTAKEHNETETVNRNKINTATTDNVQKVEITTPSYDVYEFIETTPLNYKSSTGFFQKSVSQNEVSKGTSAKFTTQVEQDSTTHDYQRNDTLKENIKGPKYKYTYNQTPKKTLHDPTKSNYVQQLTSTKKSSESDSDFSATANFASERTISLIEPYTATEIAAVTESSITMNGMDTMKLNSELQINILGNNENEAPHYTLFNNNNGHYESDSYPGETNSEITQIMDLNIQKMNAMQNRELFLKNIVQTPTISYTNSMVEHIMGNMVTNRNIDDIKVPKTKTIITADTTSTEPKETHFDNNSAPNSILAAKNINRTTSSSSKYYQILERNQENSTIYTFPIQITAGHEVLNTASKLSGIGHAPMENHKILLNYRSNNDRDAVAEVYTDSSKGSVITDKKTESLIERNTESLPHTEIIGHETTSTENNSQLLKNYQNPIRADVGRISEILSTAAIDENKITTIKNKVNNDKIETVLIVNDTISKNMEIENTETNMIDNIIPVTIIESSFVNQFTAPLNKLYDVEEITQKTLTLPDFLNQRGSTSGTPYISSQAAVLRTILTKSGTDALNYRRQKYDLTISENSTETPNNNGYSGNGTEIASTYQISSKKHHTSTPQNIIEINEESTSSDIKQTTAKTSIDTDIETTLENVYTGNNIRSITNIELLIKARQNSTEKQAYDDATSTLLTLESKSGPMIDKVYNNQTTALTNNAGNAYNITVKGPFTVEAYNASINSETDKTSELGYQSKYYNTNATTKNYTQNNIKYQNYSNETKNLQKTVVQTLKENNTVRIGTVLPNVAGNTVGNTNNDKTIYSDEHETFMNFTGVFIKNKQFETQNSSNSSTAIDYIYDDQITVPSNKVPGVKESNQEDSPTIEILSQRETHFGTAPIQSFSTQNIDNTSEINNRNINNSYEIVSTRAYVATENYPREGYSKHKSMITEASEVLKTPSHISMHTKFHTSDADAIIMTGEGILENPAVTTTGTLFDINTQSVTINNGTYKYELTTPTSINYTLVKIIPDLMNDIFTTLTVTHEQVTTNTLKHLTDNNKKATIENHNETFRYIDPFNHTTDIIILDTGTSKSNLSTSENRELLLVTTTQPKGGTMEYNVGTTDLKDNSTHMNDGVNGNQTAKALKEKFVFYKTYKPAQSTAILSLPQEINSNKSLHGYEKSDSQTSAVFELMKINAEHYINQSSNNYTSHKVSENTSLKNITFGEASQQRINTSEYFEWPPKSGNLLQKKIGKEDEIENIFGESTIFSDDDGYTYNNNRNNDYRKTTAFTTLTYLNKNKTNKMEHSSKAEADNIHKNNITKLIGIDLKVSNIVQEPVSPTTIFSKVQTKKYVTEISDKLNDKKSTNKMINYNVLKSMTDTTHTKNNAFTTAKSEYKNKLNLQNKKPITGSPVVRTTKKIRKIIYNTYKPNTDEEFDYLLDNLKVSEYKPSSRKQPSVKNTCNTLRKLSHDLIRNVQEIKKLLKASNCSQAPAGTIEGRTVHPKLMVKNIWKQPSNKENLLHPFAKTNLYPVKEISLNRHKLMRELPVKKELMTKNMQDFFARRMVTPKSIERDFKKYINPVMIRQPSRPLPRHQILRPKFETKDNPVLGEYFRPKPLFIQRDNEYYTDGFRHQQHPVGLTWKEKVDVIQNAINTQTKVNRDTIVDEALERPALRHPVVTRPKYLRDRVDSIHNYLYKADFIRPSRRPATLGNIFLDSSQESVERSTPPVFQYRRRKATYVNIEPKTTTKRPKRKGRTLFFLSPTVTDWWLDDMYLKVRSPLPINSNPGMVFPRHHFTKMEEVADLGALFIDDLLDYKEMLDRGELPLERATSREKGQALCMEQFYRLLGVCRMPEVGKDRLELPAVRGGEEETEELVVVACRNYLYPIPVKAADRGRLTPGEIQAQLLHVLVDASGAPAASRVGLLTAMHRDQWARARELLIKDENNRTNLELISRALCIVCLDEAGGDRPDLDPDTNAMLRAMHGAGTKHHSANRWFDKTVQLIISMDGTTGMCYEHSAAEGVAVVRLAERALARAHVADRPHPPPALLPAPQPIAWHLTPHLHNTIEQAARDLDRAIADLDFKVYTYRGYGREFMKSCRTSPDVYIQLALQYAHYKMYGYLVTTYESASLRRFRTGRVDNIRSAHLAALAWAAAMCTADTPPLHDHDGQKKVSFNLYGEQKKLELFEAAARMQTSIMEANILGKGIDNHLLGLREAAREAQGDLPALFTDETYKKMIEFKLSTSQVATTTEGTFMGYGAVVPDGYGCSYNPKKDCVIFCISSFTSSSVTNTEAFRQSLEEALDSMKLMFQAKYEKVDN